MRKRLVLLDELQTLDLKIDGLNAEREQLQAKVAEFRSKIEEARSIIEVKKGEYALLDEERQQIEDNIALEVENISRSEGRLKEIKTQKEYQAVQREITAAKKLKGEFDEQVLQKITVLDGMKAEIDAGEESLATLEQEATASEAEVQTSIDGIEKVVAADTEAREKIAKDVPANMMRRYTQLRGQRRGVAVAEARDGYCLGCNLNIPPQMYNMLFKGEDLVTCPHCQRMLILKVAQVKEN